jgi:hypothetical protein
MAPNKLGIQSNHFAYILFCDPSFCHQENHLHKNEISNFILSL